MNDALRSNSLIPLVEPYTSLSGFTHIGGGGETVDTSIFFTAGNDAIVDWVFLELRDKNDSQIVLKTKSALIQRDGDIVDLDGTSFVRFTGIIADDYYVSIRHRNHLGVQTSNTLELSQALTAHNFSTAQSQATGTEPMADINGLFALWAGDANGDLKVRYSDLFIPPATFISSDALAVFNELGGVPGAQLDEYSRFDLNMDGKVRYSDLFIPPATFISSDALLIFNILGGIPSAQKDQQF